MVAPFSEDQLVEQPAIALFGELGWQTVSAMEEVFGTGPLRKGEGVSLGRETPSEVVPVPRFRPDKSRSPLTRPAPESRRACVCSSR